MSRRNLYREIIASQPDAAKGKWSTSAIFMVEAETLAAAGLSNHFCADHLFRMAFRAAVVGMICYDIANGQSVEDAIANHVE